MRITAIKILNPVGNDLWTAQVWATSSRTSNRRKDAIFINLGPIFVAQFRFFVLILLYNFSCKIKIGNRIVKDPNEVAEDCMIL